MATGAKLMKILLGSTLVGLVPFFTLGAAPPGWPPVLDYEYTAALPKFAIVPVITRSNGSRTELTITAARSAPRANLRIEQPAPLPIPFGLERDDSTNPLAPNGCTPAFSSIGGQPASESDSAGAVGRGGC
jgi:hypothetical protein